MYNGIDTIYLIHHSHTDIGYTHDQPIVWDLHRRFIDTALDECERDAESDTDYAFRWTVETTAMLMHWIESAPQHRVDRFVELAKAGRIEVTGMHLNITPLYDADQVIESLAPIRFVRKELGLPVRHAMNSDVNGQNWPLVDALLDAGISAFSMATNIHFGGSPLAWPNALHWEGPSGRSILAWNGWDYGFAREIGIGEQVMDLRDRWWPKIDTWLHERDYTLPALMLQIYDAFGDNGPACPTLSGFVKEWNANGGTPRLRIALPSDWWEVVREHAGQLPTHRGDWTDYWNFGAASSAREVAINRASRTRLRSADAISAALRVLGDDPDPTRHAVAGTRNRAWEALNLWDEHTWGADCSIRQPYDEDTTVQWHHKASYAYTARSLSTMLARDAIAEFARGTPRESGDAFLVFNTLPFNRTLAGPLPSALKNELRGRPDDPTSARHSLDRAAVMRPVDTASMHILSDPIELPAFGYAVVPATSVVQPEIRTSEDPDVVTERHHIIFNLERGGIRQWRSNRLERELVDQDAVWSFGSWVQESPILEEHHRANPRRAMWTRGERRLSLDRGWQPGWAATRRGPSRVIEHKVEHRVDGVIVRQRMELPTGHELQQQTYLPSYADWIEVTSHWTMGLETLPEATYVAFPFAMPDAKVGLDLGAQVMHVDADQLPRACRDYFTVQNWVDFSNQDFGVTVATPDAPMIQIGDFTFGANLESVELQKAMLLGWVTNNYWETNFRAHQPGMVGARYRLLPHAGPLDEPTAHRFGQEAVTPPLIHHLDEPPSANALTSRLDSLLRLPASPVETLHIWWNDGSMYVRLVNASDDAVKASLGSGEFQIISATQCDVLGNPEKDLDLESGNSVMISIERRRMATIRLSVETK
jgi:hypothetical protein